MKEKQIHPFIDSRIEEYCETHTSKEPPHLHKLTRKTYLEFAKPNMISNNHQGRFLSLISKILSPKKILELGVFSGYSTLSLLEGLEQDGRLDAIEANIELEDFLNEVFEDNNARDRVKLHIGKAMDVLPKLDNDYDLIFIDADKVNYDVYYDICIEKLRKGGVIIVDNTLWYGKVALEKMPEDKSTLSIHRFNQKITEDPRVENVLIPLRDGIMIGRKI